MIWRRPSDRTREVARARPPQAVGVLRQVSPPGAALRFQFDPDALTPAPGVGGWEEVAHPRRTSSTEWRGTPLRHVSFELLFDGFATGTSAAVENACRVLEVWGGRQPGHPEPAVLQLDYGVEATRRYVLNGLEYGEALFDEHGRRLRQVVTVELLEHRPVELALTPVAKAVAKAAPTTSSSGSSSKPAPRPSGRTYTVRAGDTLSRIAQRELGKASRWTEIRDLNRDTVRDPNRIATGQRLRLPAK